MAVLLIAVAALATVSIRPDWITGRTTQQPLATGAGSSAFTARFEPTAFNADYELEPKTLAELLALPPEDLVKVDIARMNLLCAEGLPGAESLDIEALIARLDHWAEQAAGFTDNSLPDFRRRPHDFQNSEAKFRMLLVLSVLQREFGIHYQEDGFDVNYQDARYPTIYGMMTGQAGGNCASMPVMYAAVARRLGYPVSLMLGKTHIFARWDGTTETGSDESVEAYRTRFNIEGTNPVLSTHPDEYYRNWPYPISDAEVAEGWYLTPLSATEELAVFLFIRGHVLMENGRYREALHAFENSYHLAPHNPSSRLAIEDSFAALQRGNRLAYSRGRMGTQGMRELLDDGPADERYQGVAPETARRMATEQRIVAEIQAKNRRKYEYVPPKTNLNPFTTDHQPTHPQ